MIATLRGPTFKNSHTEFLICSHERWRWWQRSGQNGGERPDGCAPIAVAVQRSCSLCTIGSAVQSSPPDCGCCVCVRTIDFLGMRPASFLMCAWCACSMGGLLADAAAATIDMAAQCSAVGRMGWTAAVSSVVSVGRSIGRLVGQSVGAHCSALLRLCGQGDAADGIGLEKFRR